MKLKFIIPLLLIPSLLSGCNNQAETPAKKDNGEVTANMQAMMNASSKGYNLTFTYDDNYFTKSASIFNKKLMELSFGASVVARDIELSKNYFTTMGYDNFYISEGYLTGINENTVGYLFANKKIDDFNLIAISIRGFDYNQEWANNFEVGEEGNHNGFDKSANKVYILLKEYLEKLDGNKNIKLWLTGYSRGGAIANVLASKLMTSQEISVTKDTLYTYTFEAPRGLTIENAVAYENVFNMVNSIDIVARLLPEEYGLYRCGIDKEIYNNNIDQYLASLDRNIAIETFRADKSNYNNEKEFVDYIINSLLAHEDNPSLDEEMPYMFCDREHFVMFQHEMRYALNLIMSIPNYMSVLSNEISQLGLLGLATLLNDDGTKLFNFMKDILDDNNILYESQSLLATCQIVVTLYKRYGDFVDILILSSNGKRIIKMHMPETTYVLIMNYSEPVK